MKNLCGFQQHHYDCRCHIDSKIIYDGEILEPVNYQYINAHEHSFHELKSDRKAFGKERKIVTNFTPKKKKRK